MSLGRLRATSRCLREVFGAPGTAASLWLAYPVYRAWLGAGNVVDALFWRQHPPEPGARTILIAGPPRSGTTFLHRLLAEQTRARPTPLWESFVPSLAWQKMLRPLVARMAERGRARIDLGEAHAAGLLLPETDDFAIFARHIDSFFFFVYVLSFLEEDASAFVEPSGRPAEVVGRDLACLAAAAFRNRVNGRTPVALLKSFSAGYALDAALRELPDARIVYVSRAPHETLPSSLSMVRAVLGLNGLYARLDEPARRRHVARIVQASSALQHAAVDGLRRLPDGRVLVVRHEDLRERFAQTMERIFEHVGERPEDAALGALRSRDVEQRRRVSPHRYTLAEFGLDEADIRSRFSAVYDHFGHA